jgi:hypothetical protein
VIGVETWSNLSWNLCAGVETWNPCAGVKTGVVTVTISLGIDFAAEKEICHFDEVLASAAVHPDVRPSGQTAGSSWNSIRIEKHSTDQTSLEICFVGRPLLGDERHVFVQRPALLWCEALSHLSVPHACPDPGDFSRQAEGLCLVMKTW